MALNLPWLVGIFLILSSAISTQSYKNITLGSSLKAGDNSSSWVSPSKGFAFGFQEIQPGNFLLAIWFNQIPEKTISWSANRDQLAPSGSKVELTAGRSLILTDPKGQELWRAKLSGGTPAYAALLDTGNLVLSTQASVVIWQSFDEPTDTLLPMQTLNLGSQLIAPYSETNYSSGRVLESFITENICIADPQETGSGVCGYNSYCKFGSDSKPHCFCPPGYTLLDPNYEMGGCSQNFSTQSCQEQPHEKNEFDIKVLEGVDWPKSDYEHFRNVTRDWCREVCLDDCFCAVGIFNDSGDCWKKKLPLSNGRSDSSVHRTAFIKVRTSGDSGEFSEKYRKPNTVLMVLLGSSGVTNIVLLVVVMVGIWFVLYHKKHMQGVTGSKQAGNYSISTFRYEELDIATEGFKEELGRGAFGVVYKGIIGEILGNQTVIAVKKLDRLSRNAEKEFKSEVNTIGQTHHKNLVKLIGFCEEGEHRMLVYEFMSNGTLYDLINELPKPAWEKRLQIIHGVAQGLFYLHEECNSQIIHCDIKPQNILLDDNHNARISDFGLAKLLTLDQSHTNTFARGTRGYVAPEWFRNKPITAKVDVYSFGVLLLEVICCRRNVQAGDDEDGGVVLLTDWASDCCKLNRSEDLVSDDMEALADKLKLERMVKVAIWCTQVDPTLRPTMRMVGQMLEGLVQVPEPPNPSSYSSFYDS